MLHRPLAAFVLGSVSVLLLGAAAGRIAPTAPAPQDPAAMQEMMAKAKKFVQPGANHKQLERFLGTWTTEVRMCMGPQKSAPETGEVTWSWLMPGRWLQMQGKGQMMKRPTETFTLLGYDNFKQSFVSSMCSSLDTALTHAEGDLTPDGKAIVMYGTLDEYLTGEVGKMVKYVYRFVSADQFVLEVHDLPIGLENTMVVEITFTRKA